ncbi:MAG: nucleotidyltransferase domain-containing protein [Acidimicrobiales bacterium]
MRDDRITRVGADLHPDLTEPSPTATLLWAVARPELDSGAVRAALARGPDLELAARLAIDQRLSPLLARALTGVESSFAAMPPALASEVVADTARCRAQAALLLPVLARNALQPLVDAGFEPVVMKGGALAARYPDPGLRPMDDVDVFLPPLQHDGALRVLLAAGWERRDRIGRQHHEVPLIHPDVPGLPLELHRSFSTWSTRSSRLSANVLWRDRTPCTVGGVQCFGFAPIDELLMLVTHAAKPFHTFRRLLWITDIAVVVGAAERAGRSFDWDEVASAATQARCTTALAVALTQARMLGIDAPSALRRPAAKGVRLAALAPVLSSEWPVIERDAGIRNRLRYALVDDARLRLALLGEKVARGGPASTLRNTAGTGVRLVRRWHQLRHSGHGAREERRYAVKP